jgi:hypothetical protein
MTRTRVVVACVAAALSAGAARGPARIQGPEGPNLDGFNRAVAAYVALHRDVERSVPPLEISPDAGKIRHAVDAMAAAMQRARPAARGGEIFDEDARLVLRAGIRTMLRGHGHDPAEILAAMVADEGEPEPPRPVVNGRFSWALQSFMLPCALEALPALPDELQYRFVGRDLVLIDLHANLVVDVLPDAFPVAEW